MTTKQKIIKAIALDGYANFTTQGQRWTCDNLDDVLDKYVVALNGNNEQDLVLYQNILNVEE